MASTSYILIVEDDPSIRELIAFACAGAGFEVKACESVQKAQVLTSNPAPAQAKATSSRREGSSSTIRI